MIDMLTKPLQIEEGYDRIYACLRDIMHRNREGNTIGENQQNRGETAAHRATMTIHSASLKLSCKCWVFGGEIMNDDGIDDISSKNTDSLFTM